MVTGDAPPGYPQITPLLFYDDVGNAADWLARAFGFDIKIRSEGPDGVVAFASVRLAEGVVMLSRTDGAYRSPAALSHPSELTYVYVPDVDRHFEHARSHGAHIVSEPQDQPYGDRSYTAADPEGHRWTFAQLVADVPHA